MIDSFITTVCLLTLRILCSVLAKYQITQVTQPPSSPDLVSCNSQLFLKSKPPLKEKRFQTTNDIQKYTMGHLMATGRLGDPKVCTLKETEASLSYVQCFLYLISSSINVSIFHSTWLDTFWTDPAYHIPYFSDYKTHPHFPPKFGGKVHLTV